MSNADPYGASQQGQQKNGLSIAALVLGILSLLFGFLAAIPGIIVGHIARSKVNKDPEQYGGAGMALAGLIISYAVIVLTAVMIYLFATNPEIQEIFKEALEQANIQQSQLPN